MQTLLKKHKLHVILISTVALSVGFGWLYQNATGTLCYSKLAFIYTGNVIFWIASIRPIDLAFKKQFKTYNLFLSLIFIGLPVLLLNQVLVYLFVEVLFSLLYTCEANLLLSELILTNDLLSNIIAFGVIVLGTNCSSIIKRFSTKEKDFTNDASHICIKQNGTIHKIDPFDIVLLEADNNAVNIHTTQKRFVQYGRLKDWEQKLHSAGLVRVHRSFIINKQFIQKYQTKPSGDGILTLSTGETIRVSRNYKSNLYMHGQLLPN